MHRALQILDIQESIFDHCDRVTLCALVQTCRLFFLPAVRALWPRLSRLTDVLQLVPTEASPSTESPCDRSLLSHFQYERFWTYCQHVRRLEYLIEDEPITDSNEISDSYACSTQAIAALASSRAPLVAFPALQSAVFSISGDEGYTAALTLLSATTTELRIVFRYYPPAADILWPALLQTCPYITDLGIIPAHETHWPKQGSLQGLQYAKELRNIHMHCYSLSLEHLYILGTLPKLTTLSVAAHFYDEDSTSVKIGERVEDGWPSYPVNQTFGAIESFEMSGSTIHTSLAFLRMMTSTDFRQLRLANVWTDSRNNQALASAISDRCGNLEVLILSLICIDDDHDHWRFFRPILSCRKLTRFDFTGTSHTRVFNWSDHDVEAMAHAWPLLRELRLITFDYSYHYESNSHIPGITLAGVLAFAQYCPRLEVLQLEVMAEDIKALPSLCNLNPPPTANLTRFLIAWSRFPDSKHDILRNAWWANALWPNAIVGWGRWSHDFHDVPDGLFQDHPGFPDEDFAGIHKARRKARIFADYVKDYREGKMRLEE